MDQSPQPAGLSEASQQESLSPVQRVDTTAYSVSNRWSTAWWTTGIPVLITVLFTALAVYLAIRRHETLHTALYDTGTYTQIIWNLAHGRWFAWSHSPPIYLGNHFSPILLVLAPLFWFAPSAVTLQAVGALAVSTAVLPGYVILRSRYALLAPVLLLALVFNPLLHDAATEDIHGMMLATPILAIAVCALYTSRYRLLVATLVVSLLVREDMPAYVGLFGLYVFLFRPDRRNLGLAIGILAVVWFFVVVQLVMPALAGGAYFHSRQFEGLTSTLKGGIGVLASEPQNMLPLLLTSDLTKGLLSVLLPLAALPLLAGSYTLLWLPALLLLLAGPDAEHFDTYFTWRLAPLLPLWFASTAIAVSRLNRRHALLAVLAVFVCSLVLFKLRSPFPLGDRFDASSYTVTERTLAGKVVLQRIPPDASVATQSRLGAQMGTREQLYLYPWYDPQNAPDLIVLDSSGEDPYPLTPAELETAIVRLRLDPAVKAIWERDGNFIFVLNEALGIEHNYGVPMSYYAEALTRARHIGGQPGNRTIYFHVTSDIADRVAAELQRMGRENNQSVRVVTEEDTLLLVADNAAEHLYIVESSDTATEVRLKELGFREVEGERIYLPGGQQSLRFYRLADPVEGIVSTSLSHQGPDLHLSNGLRLQRWQALTDLRGEQSLTLVAAWEVWDEPRPTSGDPDYCVAQHLVDVHGESLVVADTRFTPTQYLRKGDLLLTWSQMPLPADLDLQQAWLQLGMFTCWQRHTAAVVDEEGEKTGGALRIGPFKVGETVPAGATDQPEYAVQARLGEEIRLAGYDVSLGGDGDRNAIRLSLYWLAEKRPRADYTVFVQVLDEGGVIAQQDNPPRGGRYPTAVWAEGEFVKDEYTLVLPEGTAAGDYRLIAGMYTPADVQRLPVSSEDGRPLGDVVELGVITVMPSGESRFGR